jgi:hypothetical protein
MEERKHRNHKGKQTKQHKLVTWSILIFFGIIIFFIGYGYGQASQYHKNEDTVRIQGDTEKE